VIYYIIYLNHIFDFFIFLDYFLKKGQLVKLNIKIKYQIFRNARSISENKNPAWMKILFGRTHEIIYVSPKRSFAHKKVMFCGMVKWDGTLVLQLVCFLLPLVLFSESLQKFYELGWACLLVGVKEASFPRFHLG
jgi:hypothetical protein